MTLRELRNPVRRPNQLRAPLSEDLLTAQPEVPFELNQAWFLKNRPTWSGRLPFCHDHGTTPPIPGF